MLAGGIFSVTFWQFRFWGWNLARGNSYSPRGKLVWIARAIRITFPIGKPKEPESMLEIRLRKNCAQNCAQWPLGCV